MEELKQLRAQLMQVQQRSTGPKLSDRNIVEIVSKLTEKYSLKLVMTVSGKEYLTPDQLRRDLEKELERQGRLNLIDLPSILNVSVDQIETFAQELARRPDVFLVNGQLLSKTYFDDLAAEINESLQETGQLLFTELSLKYSLPADMLSKQIELRLGTIVQGNFKQKNVLFTDVYMQRHLCKLRGTLRALREPAQLKNFDSGLVASQVRELIEQGHVKGTFRQGVFTPKVYQENISEQVTGFYKNNMYIEYDYMRKILGAKADIQKSIDQYIDGGKHLMTCYVHPSLVGRVQEEILEGLSSKEQVDIFMDLDLPICIGEEDIEMLLPEDTFCISNFIFSKRFIECAADLFNSEIQEIAEEYKTETIKKKGKKRGTPTIGTDRIVSVLKKAGYLSSEFEMHQEFAELVEPVVSKRIVELQNELRPAPEIDSFELLHQFNKLCLCAKGLNSIGKVFLNIKPLEVYLMKFKCWDILHTLIEIQIENQGVPQARVNSNNRNKYIAMLPEYLQDILKNLVERLNAKNLDMFIGELVTFSKDIPVISFKNVDKKTEKGLLQVYKNDMRNSTNQALNSNHNLNIVYFGLRDKLFETTRIMMDLPNELWAIQMLRDIYMVMRGQDPLAEFATAVLEDLKLKDTENTQRIEQMYPTIQQMFND